jgi:nicotinamide mononucleotide transporter
VSATDTSRQPASARTPVLTSIEITVMLAASAALLAVSGVGWLPLPTTEVLGFVTGGVCVWLVVREHMWNWPVGLANNVFFFILFLRGRLFADMSLQIVYFGLGVFGWLNWLYGGKDRSELRISRTAVAEWLALAALVPFSTWGLREILIVVNDAAPFLDALTTILSLGAQYLLCRKRLENWYFWIAADVIYIPLYISRELPLTAVLYGVFLVMCLVGLREWRRNLAVAIRVKAA